MSFTDAELNAAREFARSRGIGRDTAYGHRADDFYQALRVATEGYPLSFLGLGGFKCTPGAKQRFIDQNEATIRKVLNNFGALDSLKEATVPETIDTYNESLRPLFQKLAKAANDAGYCAEFDRIAAVAGVPSRAELLPSKNKAAWDALPIGGTFVFSDNTDLEPKVKVSAQQFYSPSANSLRSVKDALRAHAAYTIIPKAVEG